MKRNYHSKAQNKIDNRMNKYLEKTKMKHNDEIIRINEDRSRKLERDHIRNDHAGPHIDSSSKKKYLILGVTCFLLMLVSMFAMLSRKA